MFGGGRSRDNNSVPVWLIVLVVSVVTYFLSQILILAISRYREFAADRGSALITGAPEHLMSALQKIASDMFRIPQRDLREVETMNAFFIIPTSVKRATEPALPDAPAAREAPRGTRRDRPRDGPAGRRAAAIGCSGLMGLRNVLFGKKKLAGPARDRLFALTTAAVTLDTELGLRTAGAGASRLQAALGRRLRPRRERPPAAARPVSPPTPARSSSAARTSSATRGSSSATPISRIRSPAVHAVAQGLEEQGFGAQLLAAVFKFEGGKHPVYWIYGYKRGTFWPFVPTGEGQERDNAEELELKAKLEPELPVEPGSVAAGSASSTPPSRADQSCAWHESRDFRGFSPVPMGHGSSGYAKKVQSAVIASR